MITAIFFLAVALVASIISAIHLHLEVQRERETKNRYWDMHIRAEDAQRSAGMLIREGWKVIGSHGEIKYWQFRAKDEKTDRSFKQALERQRALDKIAELNLPKEYLGVNND